MHFHHFYSNSFKQLSCFLLCIFIIFQLLLHVCSFTLQLFHFSVCCVRFLLLFCGFWCSLCLSFVYWFQQVLLARIGRVCWAYSPDLFCFFSLRSAMLLRLSSCVFFSFHLCSFGGFLLYLAFFSLCSRAVHEYSCMNHTWL
jgi:hypothetical protein